jgi:hypothetical protein
MSAVVVRSITKLAVMREAASAGAALVAVTDVVTGRASTVGSAVSALFGGTFSIDAFSCFQFSTNGVPYLFVQPYSSFYPMPGEHHVWLQGTLRAPAQWQQGTFSDKWLSNDPATAFLLEQNRVLASSLRGIRWEWRIGRGEIEHPWVLQTRPFHGGLTHLAMKATGEKVGLSMQHLTGAVRLLQIAMQLQPSLTHAPGYPELPFMLESRYTPLFLQMLSGSLPPTAPAPRTPPTDFSQTILQILAQTPANKLLLHPLAPTKDSCVRNFILPPAARHLPVIAAIDTTIMNSMKEGFAFTPTHGFFKSDDATLSFAWTDVRGVIAPTAPNDDWLIACISPYGEIALPTAGRAPALAQLFHWFSQHP